MESWTKKKEKTSYSWSARHWDSARMWRSAATGQRTNGRHRSRGASPTRTEEGCMWKPSPYWLSYVESLLICMFFLAPRGPAGFIPACRLPHQPATPWTSRLPPGPAGYLPGTSVKWQWQDWMVQPTCGEDTERRKKERLPSTALPGLRNVVSSFTYLTVKSSLSYEKSWAQKLSLELVSSALSL